MSKQVARTTKTKSGRKSRRNGRNHRIKPDDLKLREKAFLYAERAPVIAYSGWEKDAGSKKTLMGERYGVDWRD